MEVLPAPAGVEFHHVEEAVTTACAREGQEIRDVTRVIDEQAGEPAPDGWPLFISDRGFKWRPAERFNHRRRSRPLAALGASIFNPELSDIGDMFFITWLSTCIHITYCEPTPPALWLRATVWQ